MKDWDELSSTSVMVTAVFFPFARIQNDHFLSCSALSQAVVTARFVSASEAAPGNHSSAGVGQPLTWRLLRWSPTFRLVYLLRACLVLPCAVAKRLPGSCCSSLCLGTSGDGGIGEVSRGGELALRSYTCLPASPLKTAPGRVTPGLGRAFPF